MSKRMQDAYRCLNCKDALIAWLPDGCRATVVLSVLSALALTAAFWWLPSAVLLAFGYATFACAVAALCLTLACRCMAGFWGRRIKRLGYSEVDLERWALA